MDLSRSASPSPFPSLRSASRPPSPDEHDLLITEAIISPPDLVGFVSLDEFIRDDEFMRDDEPSSQEDSKTRRKRRRRKYDPEVRAEVARVRAIGACDECRRRRVRCRHARETLRTRDTQTWTVVPQVSSRSDDSPSLKSRSPTPTNAGVDIIDYRSSAWSDFPRTVSDYSQSDSVFRNDASRHASPEEAEILSMWNQDQNKEGPHTWLLRNFEPGHGNLEKQAQSSLKSLEEYIQNITTPEIMVFIWGFMQPGQNPTFQISTGRESVQPLPESVRNIMVRIEDQLPSRPRPRRAPRSRGPEARRRRRDPRPAIVEQRALQPLTMSEAFHIAETRLFDRSTSMAPETFLQPTMVSPSPAATLQNYGSQDFASYHDRHSMLNTSLDAPPAQTTLPPPYNFTWPSRLDTSTSISEEHPSSIPSLCLVGEEVQQSPFQLTYGDLDFDGYAAADFTTGMYHTNTNMADYSVGNSQCFGPSLQTSTHDHVLQPLAFNLDYQHPLPNTEFFLPLNSNVNSVSNSSDLPSLERQSSRSTSAAFITADTPEPNMINSSPGRETLGFLHPTPPANHDFRESTTFQPQPQPRLLASDWHDRHDSYSQFAISTDKTYARGEPSRTCKEQPQL